MNATRLFDISLSLLGLIVGFPLFIIIGLVLYIDSPGEIIFSQKRLGKNGVPFNIHKFRKFPPDWGDKGPGVTTRGDVRMTRFGAFLERTKLDELPQLWNILMGEMAFVGPRPELTKYQNLFNNGFEKVLEFTPGIFGPNQIAYRNESSLYPQNVDPEEFYKSELFPVKAERDIAYFQQSTLASDLLLIIKGALITIFGIFNWRKVARIHLLPIMMDFIVIEVAWFAAFAFRFDFLFFQGKWGIPYSVGYWLIPLIVIPILILSRVYARPTRYFSLSDARNLFIALSLGWIASQFIILGVVVRTMSIGVSAIGLILAFIMMLFPRLLRRDLWHRKLKNNSESKGILIFGTDRLANALANFMDEGFVGSSLVGFVEDNDANMHGRRINGAKVLGSSRDIRSIYQTRSIAQLWICERVNNEKLQKLQTISDEFNVKVVKLSEIDEFCTLLPQDDAAAVNRFNNSLIVNQD